jgi:hypothetical protein
LDIVATVAGEAAKTVTASATGAVITGAAGVLRMLRRRRVRLPSDPAELTALLVSMARDDPDLAAELARELAGLEGPVAGAVPLPPAPFVDRDEVRAGLARPGLWLVAGAYGTGKTALVTRVARDVADKFGGGCAYVDLDEFRDGEALRVGEVKQAVLRQLEVTPVEAAEPELGEQYLRALLRRRFVLVVENALGAAEVRPIALPWPASLVLVTTRRLTEDLRIWCPSPPVTLHGLDSAGAWQLLAGRSGPEVLDAEPAATAELLRLCDRLPYAVLQAGVRLSRRAGRPGAVGEVLAEVHAAGDAEGVVLRCVSRTLAELPADVVDALVVLSAHPGEEFTADSTAAMLARPAGPLADELVDACLAMTGQRGRLRLPGPVRRYAVGLAGPRGVALDGPQDRVLAFYRDRAVAADLSTGDRLRLYPPVPDLPAWPVAGPGPVDWLEAEAAVIGDLIARAHHRGRDVPVTQLCGALEVLLTVRGHHWLVAAALEWGIRSALRLGDTPQAARMWAVQARIFTLLHLFDRASAALDEATRLIAGVDHPRLESSIVEVRARLAEERTSHADVPDYRPAVDALRDCLDLDERSGVRRAAGLHRRMLANVLVKAGRPGEALAALDAAAADTTDARNTARLHTVRAKALAALGALPDAAAEVARARALVATAGATQYDLEVADVEAEIAARAGDVATARARWGWIAQAYHDAGHPGLHSYLAKLNRLPQSPR